MSKRHELKWKIDAYTAETMPFDRLLEYLDHLTKVLGEPGRMHLIDMQSASTVPVFEIDDDAYPKVIERAHAVRTGVAPPEALRSYRNINRMLRIDNGRAALLEGGAEIIPFPGCDEPGGIVSGIHQAGSLTGNLQKIGGVREWVPIQLRTFEEDTVTGCYAKKSLAKQLGNHLFEPVRVYGRGTWSRTPDGEWELDKFYVDSFDLVKDEPLPSAITTLRSLNVKWQPNAIARILKDEG